MLNSLHIFAFPINVLLQRKISLIDESQTRSCLRSLSCFLLASQRPSTVSLTRREAAQSNFPVTPRFSRIDCQRICIQHQVSRKCYQQGVRREGTAAIATKHGERERERESLEPVKRKPWKIVER